MALWLISFLALSNHFIGNNLATNSVKYLVASIPNDSVLHGNEVMDFADAGYRGTDKRPDTRVGEVGVTCHVPMHLGECRALDKHNAAVTFRPDIKA